MEDLEEQYTPSKWSKRFNNPAETLENHIKFVTKESHKNKSKYNCHANIYYGKEEMQKMDIYYKDVETGNPIFVYIHGGYWQLLNKDVSGYCVAPIVENGFRVIVLDYSLCPNVTLQAIVTEIKLAAKVILKYAKNTSASSVTFCGHSAGAHLIASMLDEDILNTPYVYLLKSVFLISGVYDLTDLRKTKTVNANNILSLDEQNVKTLSPRFFNFQHLLEMKCKIFIYVAEHDSPTFIRQSRDFSEDLQKLGVDIRFGLINKCDHFDIVEKLADKSFQVTHEIISILKE